jgi:hypothetical protein
MSEVPHVSDFQIEIVRLLFSLPESSSFLLVGGMALLAQGMSVRPTEDVEAFTAIPGDVQIARAAFESEVLKRNWRIDVRRSTETFVRLHVHGPETVIVDLALDSPPVLPPTMSVLGPTFAPDEIAARKLLALFDRAMPRDFVDVYSVTRHRSTKELVNFAIELDPGMNPVVLGLAMRQLTRYRDGDLPIPLSEVAKIRAFFDAWASDLAEGAD